MWVLTVRILLPAPQYSAAAAGTSLSSGLFHGCPEAEGEEWMSGALGHHLKEDAHRWLEGAVGQHSAFSCSLLGQFGKLKCFFRAFT